MQASRCETWGSHSGVAEDSSLLGRSALSILSSVNILEYSHLLTFPASLMYTQASQDNVILYDTTYQRSNHAVHCPREYKMEKLLSLLDIRPTSAYTGMCIYCITNSLAPYMFRPPVVAIFRELFFEGYITLERQNNLIYKYKMWNFK